MTDQAPGLLPCPFCNSKVALSVLEDEPGEIISAWVRCDCGLEIHERRTEAEAIERWNTRPPSERPVAQMREALENVPLYDRAAYSVPDYPDVQERPSEAAGACERAKDALFNIARTHGYRLTDVELNEAVRAVTRALAISHAALTAERPEAGMIQANSIVSEKVCDHPSTEKAAYDIVDRLRDNANDCEDMSRWATPELSPLLRRAADEIERLRAAPPDGQVIANPANSHGSEPESEPGELPFLCPQCGARGSTDGKASTFRWSPDPSLLGRETVREETIEECAKAAERAWPRAHTYASENADLYQAQDHAVRTVVKAIRALSPLKE